MKSTAGLMTPQATRFAVLAIAFTAVFGTPASAQSVDPQNPDLDAAINRSAPPRPAAKPAAPARANTARPAQSAARPAAARPNTARPAEANHSAAARPNAARPEAARPNAAHANPAHDSRPGARHEASGRDNHGPAARGGEHAARGPEHGRPAARNASYNHGENLHGGHRIADSRFHASFGRDHQFHIGHPTMIGGQASFQFGGLWFGIVDPWPAAWLYTDAVFVDFVDGGYVLVNVAHPEVTVAVSAGDPAPASCGADPVVPAAPVVAAPVAPAPVVAVAVPVYPFLTWHYWRHYWR